MDSLDESKQRVFTKVLSTLPMNLVQGPPGVGKNSLSQQFLNLSLKKNLIAGYSLSQSHATVQHHITKLSKIYLLKTNIQMIP
jgi:replication-associated recombination protein RarA